MFSPTYERLHILPCPARLEVAIAEEVALSLIYILYEDVVIYIQHLYSAFTFSIYILSSISCIQNSASVPAMRKLHTRSVILARSDTN